jgi:ribosomal protein S18 acetylase RimI-like enzyme
MAVDIRMAQKREINALARLDAEIFGELGYPASVLRQFWDLAGPLLQVAVEDDDLVGYSLVLPSAGPGSGWFLSLGVAAHRRTVGLGRALAVATLSEAGGAGLTTLRLTVDPINATAIRLYGALGFVAERRETDYFGTGEDRLVMISRSA